jgi:tetratricopeptide (TPR) repeat protein
VKGIPGLCIAHFRNVLLRAGHGLLGSCCLCIPAFAKMFRSLIHSVIICLALLLPAFSARAEADTLVIERCRDQVNSYAAAGSDSANYVAEQALLGFIARGDIEGQAHIITILANLDLEQGRYEQAKIRTLFALDIFRKRAMYRQVVVALNFAGTVELALNNSRRAEDYFNDALELHDTIPSDNSGLMLTYMNLARVYMQNNELESAQKNYSLAELTAMRVPISDSVVSLYHNIAWLYTAEGRVEPALHYLEKALRAAEQAGLAEAKARSLFHLGKYYEEAGDAARAVTCWNEALAIACTKNMYALQMSILLDAAAIAKPQYVSEYLDKAMEICNKLRNPVTKAHLYGQMALLYERQGQYMNALYAARKQSRIVDSIDRINREKEFRSKNILYELERSNLRVKELQQLSRKNATQSTIITIFSISTLVAFIVMIFLYDKANRLNRRMAQHEKELANLNNMKNKLFSIIGHDLRAPLAKIYTVLDLYDEGVFSEEEKKEIIIDLKDHTRATSDTLDKMLFWGKSLIKGDDLKQGDFEPRPVIAQNIALKRTAAVDKNITITDTTPEQNTIYADKSHFDFIIRNLLANAIKFTYQNGRIDIGCNTAPGGDMAIFYVRDTGKGMSKQQLAKLFEPFHTTDGTDHEKGTGIGLMLCKEFAVKNGGDLWAESEEGQGSTFYFSLKKSNITLN